MSMKTIAKHSVVRANNHLGGANSTKYARKKTCYSIIEYCASIGQPLATIKDISFFQVKGFVDFKQNPPPGGKKKGATVATLHNIVSSIRTAIKALKGDPDALGITAKKLGLPSKRRFGTKEPIPDEVFFKAIATAEEMGQLGYAILLKVERYFGHRGQEALMSIREVRAYIEELPDCIRLANIDVSAPEGFVLPEMRITDGTKSGKPRVTASIAKYAKESLETLLEAVTYLETHKYLVVARKDGLKPARSLMHRIAKKVGLTGKYAPHSLRYRYASDKVTELRDAGWSALDAFILVTRFLGHGKTRANVMIKQVYGQKVAATFPKKAEKKGRAAEIKALKALIEAAFPDSEVLKKLSVGANEDQPASALALTPSASPVPDAQTNPPLKQNLAQSSIKARRLSKRSERK